MFVVTVLTTLGGPVVKWVCWPGRAFDPVAWRDAGADYQDNARQPMADRMVARQTLIGKTRDEVIQMLGEPESPVVFDTRQMYYRLGYERWGFLEPDFEYLHLQFGPDGRVCDALIHVP